MNCDRAFVSLIDSSTQYILAEATRSISIRDSTSFANPQDALFLGVQSLNKEYGICPQSVAIFTDRTGHRAINTPGLVANTTRYVIRDLRELDQYKHCPYVVGFPHMVSYAEVPVKSASGHILGTYCVMDNKVRDDFFNDSTIDILNDIAACITEQLELHAIRHESGRGVQMMRGLSEFIESRRSRADRSGAASRKASLATIADYFDDPPQKPDAGSLSTSLDSQKQSLGDASMQDSTPPTSPEDLLSLPSPGVCDPALDMSHKPLSGCRTMKDIYSGAAHLIRAAIDVEGLVFLHRSANNVLPGLKQSLPEPVSAAGSGHNATSSLCEVLGSSVVPGGNNLGTLQFPLVINDVSLDYLIRNFPRGCVFVSDTQGDPVFEKEGAFIVQTYSPQTSSAVKVSGELQSLIRKARSLVFLPLWDSMQESFIVGMLGWTSDPTRVLAEQDMTCLSAFGNTFMTEIARTEMTELARAKSDFLSSISHELRSPLHGIHAAVDLLQDPEHDSKSDLIEMIASCSSTLLDTLNHVLDFSRVNKLTDVKVEPQNPARVENQEMSQNAFGETTQEYLCDLVLSVVEGLHFGQASRKATYEKLQSTIIDQVAKPNLSPDAGRRDSAGQKTHLPQGSNAVAVYVDIESRSDWCMMVCAGAWKRLVMNLFANAMKYTDQGFVEVSLRIISDPKSPAKRCAHLLVSDTGIGMSPDFLKRSLYQPFVQENPIADGTGLGLSIVKKIVEDLQGTIEVQSTQGVGTRFDVFVPIPAPDSSIPDAPLPFGGQRLDPESVLKDRTVCLLSPPGIHGVDNVSASNAELQLRRTTTMQSCVRSITQSWFGMKVVTSDNLELVDTDIVIAEQTHLSNLIFAKPELLCKLSQQRIVLVDALPAHYPSKSELPGATVNLAYPLSPKTLVRALTASLKTSLEPQTLSSRDTLPLGIPPPSVREPVAERLDVHQPQEVAEQTKQDNRPSGRVDTAVQQDQQHFLLVDDNAINLRLLATFMKKLGHTSETAVNGLEAFEKFKASSWRFTTVLMDISMPVMNGYESSRAIRRHEMSLEDKGEKVTPARIIALTGLGSEASKQEAKMSGIDEFYTKPVKFDALREVLERK
ncbi:hypothetical protein M436DRAFT_76988 [Aureobasidium namibiae CBS 147.97]|uniref:histidine kinase n=1 Tax=Aureobasidium namibiae CBS 147.97 TaxID=1043004 RepID=A0A074W5F2_9PEZI|nr:uncharacterized protein M436DRAFT_76988 [Aureobasidium namibiae CBS 147.97]KEQ68365.1 hypothetical protein M436DRAFT_76988 [Aureobasidium namibiae CBS 147.97]